MSEVVAFDASFTNPYVMGPPGGPPACRANATVLVTLDYTLGLGSAHLAGMPCVGPGVSVASVFFDVPADCVGSPAGDIACHHPDFDLFLGAGGAFDLDITNPAVTNAPGMVHKVGGHLVRM